MRVTINSGNGDKFEMTSPSTIMKFKGTDHWIGDKETGRTLKVIPAFVHALKFVEAEEARRREASKNG